MTAAGLASIFWCQKVSKSYDLCGEAFQKCISAAADYHVSPAVCSVVSWIQIRQAAHLLDVCALVLDPNKLADCCRARTCGNLVASRPENESGAQWSHDDDIKQAPQKSQRSNAAATRMNYRHTCVAVCADRVQRMDGLPSPTGLS